MIVAGQNFFVLYTVVFSPLLHSYLSVNIQVAIFRLQPSRFGIAERGKFYNVSYTPLAVAISKK